MTQHRQRLCRRLGRTVRRVADRHPEMKITDMCSAFGIMAGAAIAEVVPAGNPEIDAELGNLVGLCKLACFASFPS